MKKILFYLMLGFFIVTFNSGCCVLTKQTIIKSSKKRTAELLEIHSSICPRIPFKMKEAKIVFFSDLHRGMGTKDLFQNNKELYVKILKYYNQKGYTLVLVGDMEEGWGFQKDNIPLILEDHEEELEMEMEFLKDNRYYRVYGNHDDFYRGHYFKFKDYSTRVYPAVIFKDKEKDFTIFVTHGCQGHGLHDAGDELATWAVYVRYNWLAEILLKRVKSKKKLVEVMENREKDYKHHEKMLVDWVRDDGQGNRRFNILIAGHTHIPVFESIPVEESYELIQKNIKEGKFIFFNDVFKGQEKDVSLAPPEKIKTKMIKTLGEHQKTARRLRTAAIKMIPKGKEHIHPREAFYYNPGFAFGSEIPCIEIKDGKISLKFIKDVKDDKLDAIVLMKLTRDFTKKEKKYERSLDDYMK